VIVAAGMPLLAVIAAQMPLAELAKFILGVLT
jgi:hypothetical protein